MQMVRAIFVAVLIASCTWAQETPAEAPSSDVKSPADKAKERAETRRKEIAKSAVVKVRLATQGDVSVPLHEKPIYKYHEVLRGFHHATTWMWGGESGRPEMILNLSGGGRSFLRICILQEQSASLQSE